MADQWSGVAKLPAFCHQMEQMELRKQFVKSVFGVDPEQIGCNFPGEV